jgi:SAM-dependent methyltransferase
MEAESLEDVEQLEEIEVATFVDYERLAARQYAERYERGLGRWAAAQEEQVLRAHLACFPSARTVLDAGCGTGQFSRFFERQGLQVTGLDISAAMLDEARSRGGDIAYVEGDALDLPFDNSSIDLVALITVLEFVPDPVRVLEEAMRVARLGLLLGVLNRRSASARLRRIGEWMTSGDRMDASFPRPRRYGVRELAELAQAAAGAQPVEVTWRTAIFPAKLRKGATRLPWGDYLGMAVRWPPAAPPPGAETL